MQHLNISADDGETLHLHRRGEGPPVLLLHGWTSSHMAFSPLVEQLSNTYQVLRPDARGHGDHRLTVNPAPDVQRLARDVINLLDHLKIDRVVAVGHSMGALTLWQCLRDYGSARFSHLAFVDQSPKLVTDASWDGGIYGDFDANRSQQLISDLERDFIEAVLRLVAFGLNDKARASYLRNSSGWRLMRESLQTVDPGSAIAIWKSLVAADYRDVLPKINVPTLLACGTCSNFYTAETARFVATQTPGAQLSFYDGADHGPHLAQPERFVAELRALINTPSPQAISP
ncbi:alpha/beta fold hydrolase [Rhodoferax fermentans]|uniref:Alpha/beta hydrolase n=1 Tax=Rhodoferax fermentans TaxID=28066 RepID=A0A1T1ATP5_RHOFE|nr:alpha/beta hydrolase [Rhodoferax fermentans]MBK1683027.1 alpha/beta hydrolase [Rhodoferax fermentans]OOV07461.1 alpha/beta hydrolase [Rhodoferax fermentans]